VLWNILAYIQPSPQSVTTDDTWAYLVFLVEAFLDRLMERKLEHDSTAQEDASVMSEDDDSTELVRVPWFHHYPDINISLLSNLTGFVIQVLVVREKWENLIHLCTNYNVITQNFWALPVLPFKIYAERMLWERAKTLTDKRKV
jgi:hypothetical protein